MATGTSVIMGIGSKAAATGCCCSMYSTSTDQRGCVSVRTWLVCGFVLLLFLGQTISCKLYSALTVVCFMGLDAICAVDLRFTLLCAHYV